MRVDARVTVEADDHFVAEWCHPDKTTYPDLSPYLRVRLEGGQTIAYINDLPAAERLGKAILAEVFRVRAQAEERASLDLVTEPPALVPVSEAVAGPTVLDKECAR